MKYEDIAVFGVLMINVGELRIFSARMFTLLTASVLKYLASLLGIVMIWLYSFPFTYACKSVCHTQCHSADMQLGLMSKQLMLFSGNMCLCAVYIIS